MSAIGDAAMSAGRTLGNVGRAAGVTAAVGINVLAAGAPAVASQLDAPQNVETAGIEMVDDLARAIGDGVEGKSQGDDAAASEPVPEPEYSAVSDPPEGWSNQGWDAWADPAAEADSDRGDAEPADAAAEADHSGDAEGLAGA